MELLKIFKNEDFGFKIFYKGHILRPFSGTTPTKIKMLTKYLRVKYVYIYTYIYRCICRWWANGIYIYSTFATPKIFFLV